MKRYIEYNISDGSINGIKCIHEEDTSFYITDTVSLSNIGNLEVDIRNSYFDLSAIEVKVLPTLPIQYNTLSYEISSSNSISFSSVPVNTQFTIEYNSSIINDDSLIDDSILTFTTDTPGVYTLKFDNSLYNNLSSSTYSITAL
tara:strand:- start:1305 stop:1736 length:432 start_codon:yes stop_codon:yes gene_type:complete